MNPPSALYGAMNKERKPFTYTPGGLDLSEIKSERMAKRLMRNAMNQGVPETPSQTIQSSPPVTPGVLPNFNCLPVQVFPAFQLPANPKSLLRTRSNPDGPKEPTVIEKHSREMSPMRKDINKPLPRVSNNKLPLTINDNKVNKSYIPVKTPPNYGSYGETDVFLPEKSYDAEYYQVESQGPSKLIERKNTVFDSKPVEYIKFNPSAYNPNILLKTSNDSEVNPVTLTSMPSQDIATKNYDQKEVKIVKKHTKTENETKQNGDTEAAVVVKLPSKSSAAKTETKVEILKKILPDGTIEEVKTTTTKTTIDGKTEISTKTETRTLPKEIVGEVVEIEEQEDENDRIVKENENDEIIEESKSNETELENGKEVVEDDCDDEVVSEKNENDIRETGNMLTGEEKLETSTTKKVVVIQSTGEESEEEIEEEIEEEVEEEVEEEEECGDVDVEEVVILKKPQVTENKNVENENEEIVEEEKISETATVLKPDEQKNEKPEDVVVEEVEGEEVNEEVDEEVKGEVSSLKAEKDVENVEQNKEEININVEMEQNESENTTVEEYISKEQEEKKNVEEYEEAEDSEVKVEGQEKLPDADETTEININIELEPAKHDKNEDTEVSVKEPIIEPTVVKENAEKEQFKDEIIHKTIIQTEPRVSFREPSIPFEKVEDIEIKPIGPAQEIIKKSHTEIITTTSDKPSGALSTQTEYNRIENIVTVNRTSKTLDHAYEQTQQQIPAIKTPYAPINDRILSTPQPISRTYQPVYPPEPQTERRHSLLLERLSVDRQVPTSEIYQNNHNVNQSYEQNQWSEEPQSEVLTVSNVKPSTITKNQQWYQQTKKENILSNTVSPTPVLPSQIWSQQNQSQTQAQTPAQPPYQTFTQQQYTLKPEYQASYVVDNNAQNLYKGNTNNLQQNVYPSYVPKPSWVSSTFESKPAPILSSNQYSTLSKESTETFQKSTQQFNSSYVPPPWEQDSNYIPDNQNYYQPLSTVSYTPTANQQPTWKPNPTPNKFSKPTPTSYIPPAPNQSFVKPVTSADGPKMSGRKTYYSEYERRYISVPESTYIPNETKFPAQPDPSPQYYYDNNEPTESVEPQWRKELREFTEKTTLSTTHTDNSSVRPPWEEDAKYVAPSEYTATVTPSWTQTLRPRSWRERSYEPEYIGSKEWPKTNTLGRGRPQSSYVRSNVDTIPERPRGVSVDRYNPNNYQSPLSSEHPPVQSHTLDPTIHPKTYHNPHVPAYHARASAEPREQTTAYPQQRMRADSRAPPVQSRSFKYLQWITGTED